MYRKIVNYILNHPLSADHENNVESPVFMVENKLYSEYEIGEWTYGEPNVVTWGEGAKLRIGRFTSISQGVTVLLGGEHRADWVTTYPFNILWESAKHFRGHPKTKGNVTIGNDVWIGRDVLILSGVSIGDGAVVGARSVVTKDVAPYAIVAGNPAKQIKLRFPQETIDALLEIAWWNWPISEIEQALPFLLDSDIAGFIGKFSGQSQK